jgi:predicted RNase H-like HicB family nuclease
MDFIIDFEQEIDGRWIAEIPELPGVLAYGTTQAQAGEKAKALAFRVLAERIETESSLPYINHVAFSTRYESVAVN